MKRGILFTLLASAMLIVSASCNKGCNLAEEDTIGGVIIEDASVFPKSGMITSNMMGDYHVHGANNYASEYEISFDGGLTKQSVNYSQYSILAFPITVSCDAAFERIVTVDDANQTAVYTLKVKECDENCSEQRTLENYVLVPAIPSNYTILYNKE